jgi:uncharacterized protein
MDFRGDLLKSGLGAFRLDFVDWPAQARRVPIYWECQRCTACCRWPGQVKVTDPEITALAAHLGLTDADFIQRHTRLRPDRQGLALEELADGTCVFLEDCACRVQAVKPQQCRDFPHRWTHPDAAAHCRALPREVDAVEYEEKTKGTAT